LKNPRIDPVTEFNFPLKAFLRDLFIKAIKIPISIYTPKKMRA
jgi:hypothetical protein